MAVNKVVYGNTTLLDLTDDTATAGDVLSGATFHDRSGTLRTGTCGITKTITVYSAAVDTVAFTDMTGAKTVTTNASGEGTVSVTYLSGMVITFTSSVAKDPDNLSADYKKSVQLLEDTTEIYVMPNGVCYWFGYKSSEYQIVSTANGWSPNTITYHNPTESTNYLTCDAPDIQSGVSQSSGIGFKNSITGNTVKCIYQGVKIRSDIYGSVMFDATKTCSTLNVTGFTSNAISLASIDIRGQGDVYACASATNNRTVKIYALWCDSENLLSDKADISAIAFNEDGDTCKNPNGYKKGEHFYKNGKFCTAKTDIASGATFTLGTNYTEGTVAEFVNTAYTETERDTGIKWIDGKTVYEKVIYVPYSSMVTDGSYKVANISPGAGTSIIDISGTIGTSRGKSSISAAVLSAASNDSDNLLVRSYYGSIAFRASGTTTIATWSPYVYAIVKYIKTS